MCADLVTIQHLNRHAIVYVRQSTPHQVVSNQESLRLQYALRERAKQLGWHDADIWSSLLIATWRSFRSLRLSRKIFGRL